MYENLGYSVYRKVREYYQGGGENGRDEDGYGESNRLFPSSLLDGIHKRSQKPCKNNDPLWRRSSHLATPLESALILSNPQQT